MSRVFVLFTPIACQFDVITSELLVLPIYYFGLSGKGPRPGPPTTFL
jgi:hypothetical protein